MLLMPKGDSFGVLIHPKVGCVASEGSCTNKAETYRIVELITSLSQVCKQIN
jgi:hypothetical protein